MTLETQFCSNVRRSNTEPDCEGYLQHVNTTITRPNQSSYVALYSNILYYWDQKSQCFNESPTGFIDMCTAELIEDKTNCLAWSVQVPQTKRPHIFIASNLEEKERWLTSLRQAKLSATFTSPIIATESSSSLPIVPPPNTTILSTSNSMNVVSNHESNSIIISNNIYSDSNNISTIATRELQNQPCARNNFNTVNCNSSSNLNNNVENSTNARLTNLESNGDVQDASLDEKAIAEESNSGQEEIESTTVFRHASTSREKISLNDFEIIAVIGRGSFGRVYEVRKKRTGEVYAMKEMSKDVVERENLTEHIFAEKSILQTISHPFIVTLHYAFQTKDRLFLILDLLQGGELFFHLGEAGVFDEYRAKFYTAEIALAIGYLHSLKIIYRDLKLENVVLDKDGHACLTDFGLAKTNVCDASANTFCGTSEYLAPELLLGSPHGKAVDWWSLGILFYEMLFGIPPYYDENVNVMYEAILAAPLEFKTDQLSEITISDDAKDLLTRLLDRDPDTRLQTITDLQQHPLFADLNFEQLYARKIAPPFRPDPETLNNFDKEFTAQPPAMSMDDFSGEHHNLYGFTFDSDNMYANRYYLNNGLFNLGISEQNSSNNNNNGYGSSSNSGANNNNSNINNNNIVNANSTINGNELNHDRNNYNKNNSPNNNNNNNNNYSPFQYHYSNRGNQNSRSNNNSGSGSPCTGSGTNNLRQFLQARGGIAPLLQPTRMSELPEFATTTTRSSRPGTGSASPSDQMSSSCASPVERTNEGIDPFGSSPIHSRRMQSSLTRPQLPSMTYSDNFSRHSSPAEHAFMTFTRNSHLPFSDTRHSSPSVSSVEYGEP